MRSRPADYVNPIIPVHSRCMIGAPESPLVNFRKRYVYKQISVPRSFYLHTERAQRPIHDEGKESMMLSDASSFPHACSKVQTVKIY